MCVHGVMWWRAAQVYTRLNERLGLNDHLLVLNVMLSKIATNLKVYGACDDVITATLALFQVPCPVQLKILANAPIYM